MKKLSLATTALYLTLASSAFADSNSLIITQASVGAGVPSLNFTQSGSGASATITQTGLNALTGVQTGTGAQFTATQSNPTSGAVNTINYTGSNNSKTVITQGASDASFIANASVGNTANVSLAGTPNATYTANQVAIDQVGYNNSANITSTFAGTSGAEIFNVVQHSDNANSGNQFTATATNGTVGFSVFQLGGNKATTFINGGSQGATLTQINTADNIASANVANISLGSASVGGAGTNFYQAGTNNTLNANLTGVTYNAGVVGIQNGNGNLINAVQNAVYLDYTTGHLADTITQTGNNNTANADQEGTGNSRYDITQSGVLNVASLTQSGTNNLSQITQNGTSNNALINQGGTGNSALISQTGNNNQGTINQTGISNVAQIIQASNNNVASITQSGTGMTTVIHQ